MRDISDLYHLVRTGTPESNLRAGGQILICTTSSRLGQPRIHIRYYFFVFVPLVKNSLPYVFVLDDPGLGTDLIWARAFWVACLNLDEEAQMASSSVE